MKKIKPNKGSKPNKVDTPSIKAQKSKKPCPSGFYRNKKGICVQASVGPEFKP